MSGPATEREPGSQGEPGPRGVGAVAAELAENVADAKLPLLEVATERQAHLDVHGNVKPTWRGWIHAATFPLATIAGLVLIALGANAPARWSAAVFTLTSLLLFGISAVYHRFDWKPTTLQLFRRLDHSNIFLLIAGTYTPLAVCALTFPKSAILLSIIWAGALLGIAFRVFWLSAPRWLYVVLYIVLGWAAMLYIVDLVQASVAMMVLVLVGGVAYTTGAVFYALKRPNPAPGVFGFHELFHSCTVLAFLCHWTAILLIVIHPVWA